MKKILFIAATALIFWNCGTTGSFDYGEYARQMVIAFSNATNTFFQGDYKQAKDLLTEYTLADSMYEDYEAYAFLAECYNKLGEPDSGRIVYENIIHKLKEKVTGPGSATSNKNFFISDLEKWLSEYPRFPEVLKKENGFVPYDDLPDPIGGISAIQGNVVPPAGDSKGTVMVMALINESGRAVDFSIYRGLEKEYNDAAVRAVKNTRFEIPKRKGRPYKMWLAFPIIFK